MKKLWAEVGIIGWTSLLRRANCAKVTTINETDIECCCPYHDEATPSFRIRVNEGYIKCFGCQKFETNPIKFVSEILTKGSYTSALAELRSFGLRSISEKDAKKLKADEIKQKVYNEIAFVCKKSLQHACANYTGDKKQPETKTIDYLVSRGIPVLDPDFDVGNLPIGLLPSKAAYVKYKLDEPEKVHEFFKGWLDDNLSTFKGALVFLYYSNPSELSGFRIRYEFLNPKRWKEKQLLTLGPPGESIGFFGLGCFYSLLGRKGKIKSDALVVEGEFDLLRQFVHYLKSGVGYDTILCTAGGGLTTLDVVEDFGISTLYLALDNYNVDSSGLSLLKGVLKNTSLKSYVYTWPFMEKDPAEVIATHGWEKWRDSIKSVDNRRSRINFTSSSKFLVQLFKDQHTFPVQDLRAAVDSAANLGACLKNSIDRREYTAEVCEILDVPKGTLLGTICAKEDTEEGFVNRCAEELRATYEFIGKTEYQGKTHVTLWHRGNKKLKTIETTKGTAEFISSISTDLGAPIEWVKKSVGVPRFIAFSGKGEADCSYIRQNTLVRQYLDMTLNNILAGLPTTQKQNELGQGSHYISISLKGEKVPAWVIVNGDTAYLGTFATGQLHFSEIKEPRIDKYYFNFEGEKVWSEELKSSDDLNIYCDADTCPVTIKECYDWLVKLLDACWVMEEGHAGMQYLASAMMLTCINSILPRQLYTIINGKAGTGKSAFLNLLGAGDDPKYRLLECVNAHDTISAAGFVQEMNNRTGAQAFDEFEISAKEPKKTAAVNAILGYLRGLINKRYHKVLQGTQSGKSREYIIKCCIWACSIESLRQPADISRFVRFRTIPISGKEKQEAYLMHRVGLNVVKKFRRFLTLGLFKYANEYTEVQEKLYSEYLSGEHSEALSTLRDSLGEEDFVPSRLLEASLLTGAVAKLAGTDPHKYIINFCKSQSENIEEIAGSSASQELISDILSARVTLNLPGLDTRVTTIRSLLSDPSDRLLINEINCGIRYLEVTNNRSGRRVDHWLIFMWTDLLSLLRENKSQIYKVDTPNRLKNRLAPDQNVIKTDTASKRLGKLKPYLKVGIRKKDVSIYDITPIIGDWEDKCQD